MGDQWPFRRYEPLQEIGVGAYGTVYRARDLENDGRIVALKRLRVQASEEGMPLATVREIALLKQLESFDHPNVVRLLDVCCGRRTPRETRLMLVFEHVDYDLESFMNRNQPVQLDHCRDITRQLLSGLDFLHTQRVIHRDLKPQNVLISSRMQVRIADFGLARLYCADSSLTQVVVTLWYRAPEVLLHRSYHSGVDLWGCGCIVAELLNGQPLFQGDGEVSQLREIFRVRGLPAEADFWRDTAISRDSFPSTARQDLREVVPRACDGAITLLQGLLEIEISQRFSATDSLRCSWFEAPPRPQAGGAGGPPGGGNDNVAATSGDNTTQSPTTQTSTTRPHRRPSQDTYDNESLTKRTRPN